MLRHQKLGYGREERWGRFIEIWGLQLDFRYKRFVYVFEPHFLYNYVVLCTGHVNNYVSGDFNY